MSASRPLPDLMAEINHLGQIYGYKAGGKEAEKMLQLMGQRSLQRRLVRSGLKVAFKIFTVLLAADPNV